MSRLEQMRINFLQRLQAEQNRTRLSAAKSLHNVYHATNHCRQNYIETLPKAAQNCRQQYPTVYNSPLRRTSSGFIDHHPPQHPKQQQRWQYAFPAYPVFQEPHQQQFYQDYMIQIPKKTLSRVKSWSHLNVNSQSIVKRKGSITAITSPGPTVTQTNNVNKRQANTSAEVQQQTNRIVKSQVARNTSAPTATTSRNNSTKIKSTIGQNRVQSHHECKHCSRKFAAPERLQKHSAICGKTFNKHRIVFDSGKQRLNSAVPFIVQQNQKIENDANGSQSQKGKTSIKSSFAEWKLKQKGLRNSGVMEGAEDVVIYEKPEKPSNFNDNIIKYDNHTKQCAHCNRIFAPNVISKHEIICEKIGKYH